MYFAKWKYMKSCKNRQNKKEILGEYIYKQKNEKKKPQWSLL